MLSLLLLEALKELHLNKAAGLSTNGLRQSPRESTIRWAATQLNVERGVSYPPAKAAKLN